MSFILDQLKKSGKKRELELAMQIKSGTRSRQAAGTSQTGFQPTPGPGIHMRGIYLLSFLAAASFFALGGFMLFRGSPGSRQEPVAAREAQVQIAEPSAAKADPGKAAPAPAVVKKMPDEKVKTPIPPVAAVELRNQPGSSDQQEVAAPPPQERSGPQDDARRTPFLNELTASLQKELPPVRITSHLYRGSSRLVSINGRIMSEGVSMDGGLFLDEITPEGVILSFRGHRFRVRAD